MIAMSSDKLAEQIEDGQHALANMWQRNSCPAFSTLVAPEDLDGSSPAASDPEDSSAQQLAPSRIKSGSLGGGWFEQHLDTVGAPRPVRYQQSSERTPELKRQRDSALKKVSHMAERYREQLEQSRHQPLRTARSSPNLHDACRRSPALAKDNGKQRPKDPAQPGVHPCLEGCGASLEAIVGCFRTALQGARIGSAEALGSSPASPVIIFDWDDTLLPTSYIVQTVIPSHPQKDHMSTLPPNSPYTAALAAHGHLVGFLLRAARRVARVAIVSNSLSPWVEASAANYLPGLDLEALLEELEVPVFYARRHVPNIAVTYETTTLDIALDRSTGGRIGVDIIPDPNGSLAIARIEEGGLMDAWNKANPGQEVEPGDRIAKVNGSNSNLTVECRKLQKLQISVVRSVPDIDPYVVAKRMDMETCLDNFYAGHELSERNVLSIGDANTEQRALKEILQRPCADRGQASSRPASLCKTVNLLDNPSLEQLSNELRILLVWLDHMVKYDKDFDLSMDGLDNLERQLFEA